MLVLAHAVTNWGLVREERLLFSNEKLKKNHPYTALLLNCRLLPDSSVGAIFLTRHANPLYLVKKVHICSRHSLCCCGDCFIVGFVENIVELHLVRSATISRRNLFFQYGNIQPSIIYRRTNFIATQFIEKASVDRNSELL